MAEMVENLSFNSLLSIYRTPLWSCAVMLNSNVFSFFLSDFHRYNAPAIAEGHSNSLKWRMRKARSQSALAVFLLLCVQLRLSFTPPLLPPRQYWPTWNISIHLFWKEMLPNGWCAQIRSYIWFVFIFALAFLNCLATVMPESLCKNLF